MKLMIFFFMTSFLFSISIQAQCSLEEIFSIKHGISKFKAATIFSSLKTFNPDNEKNESSSLANTWEHFDYLKEDSVLISRVYYKIYNTSCFQGDKNELLLQFADDKLYKIEISIQFSDTGFSKCIGNYNSLLEIFKADFYDWEPFTTTNSATNEQIGEGYWFYPSEKREKIKLNRLAVDYRIEYEIKWDTSNQKYYKTNNIKNYILEIAYMNLNGTKLTNEGF